MYIHKLMMTKYYSSLYFLLILNFRGLNLFNILIIEFSEFLLIGDTLSPEFKTCDTSGWGRNVSKMRLNSCRSPLSWSLTSCDELMVTNTDKNVKKRGETIRGYSDNARISSVRVFILKVLTFRKFEFILVLNILLYL